MAGWSINADYGPEGLITEIATEDLLRTQSKIIEKFSRCNRLLVNSGGLRFQVLIHLELSEIYLHSFHSYFTYIYHLLTFTHIHDLLTYENYQIWFITNTGYKRLFCSWRFYLYPLL
jgi:hypothetical protein